MSLKAKLVSVISAFVLILTVAIVSVWAVSQANVTMGGTVGFKADNVYAKVSATVSGMDSNPTLPTLIFSEGEDASPETDIEKWNNLNLVFNTSGTPIEIEVTVENLSGERAFYAKIDDQIGVVANLTKTVTSSSQDALGRYIEVPISSSISYTITLSPTNPNKSVNGEYKYLITLIDESETQDIEIQANPNMETLGSVSGGGTYAIGDTVTLTATRSGSNSFLAWATSTDPNTMEILSTSTPYSFELAEDSPTTYYALFNSTTTTEQTFGDLVYTFYNEAKLAEITGPDSSFQGGDFTIPSVVLSGENSYKIYSIGSSAFYNCRRLTSITIPEGVTSIGDSAFYYCGLLTSITIPEGVTSIGDQAFYYCERLTSITIPEGATSIGSETFYCCKALTSITLPSTLTSIVSNAFYNCFSLTSITIPERVTSILGNAFSTCSSLEAFYGNGNSYYTINDNRALIVDGGKTLLAYAPGNTEPSYSIPEGVTSIGDEAFYNCSSLTSITIPEGVTSISYSAFSNCSSLTSITIPEGVTSIDNFAFDSCSGLTSITIPEGVTSIGTLVFNFCSGLTSITLPSTLTSIGSSAFYYCSSLTEITINGNISTLESDAFQHCTNLTKLTLGAEVTSLPDGLFGTDNLENLITIVVAEGSTLSAALPTYGTWVKDGGSETVKNFSGAGTYTRTDIQ